MGRHAIAKRRVNPPRHAQPGGRGPRQRPKHPPSRAGATKTALRCDSSGLGRRSGQHVLYGALFVPLSSGFPPKIAMQRRFAPQ